MKMTGFPVLALLGLFTSCSYTAPYRRMEVSKSGRTPAGQQVIVTLTEVRHQPGKRTAFFGDTMKVLDDLPNHRGLLGYSFRFQLLGSRAWTMTAWEDEAALDRFARSPAHRAAVTNSRVTAQSVKIKSISVPFSELPLPWREAQWLLDKEPE